MAEVHIHLVRYEVECDACGVIDSGVTKREANKIRKQHFALHCTECDGYMSRHTLECSAFSESEVKT